MLTISRKEALGEDDKKNTESFLADENCSISLKSGHNPEQLPLGGQA